MYQRIERRRQSKRKSRGKSKSTKTKSKRTSKTKSKRTSKTKKSQRKTEDIFVYPPVEIIKFSPSVANADLDGFEKDWKQKCKEQKINVKYVGSSGTDEAMFTIPTGTYTKVKKCWEDTLTKHGIKKTWPIAKSYEQLEKKKQRLGLGWRDDDVERMRLKSRKSPKKSPKPTKRYAKGDKEKCGKMPKRLNRIKTPKECVKVLTGARKGKHVWVTKKAARAGGYDPYH
jgi:hypothetical protein